MARWRAFIFHSEMPIWLSISTVQRFAEKYSGDNNQICFGQYCGDYMSFD